MAGLNVERGGRARLALVLLALVVVGCDATSGTPQPSGAPSSAEPGASQASVAPSTAEPGASAPAEAAAATSQALIADDLASGAITLPESLRYRAWALFGDARLPERYDGTGSAFEDGHLFEEIAEILPSLPADQQAELETYLLRPTDPRSPFTAAESGSAGPRVVLAQAAEPAPNACAAPRRWVLKDWSPNGDVNTGIRAWACDMDDAVAEPDLDAALDVLSKLWAPMTRPVPNGMGLPIPDTTARVSDGNGKIDVYLLEPLATCRQRGTECQPIPGGAAAAAAVVGPSLCGVAGFPARGCAAFMIVGRQWLGQDFLVPLLAHEFFHVLQKAHHVGIGRHWYVEASATWAEWRYVAQSDLFEQRIRDYARDALYARFATFQDQHSSLLLYSENLAARSQFQYDAWVWPLFQDTGDPGAVFKTWAALETATDAAGFDAAIDRVTSFRDRFREFAVWNAQPATERQPVVDEMTDDRWQTKPDLETFPLTQHALRAEASTLAMGRTQRRLATPIGALEVHYERFRVEDDAIRQITIDIGGLAGKDHASLDAIGLVQPAEGSDAPRWRRYAGTGTQLLLCRDDASQDVIDVEVVISNHAFARSGNGPDPAAALTGTYAIEAKDECAVPDGFTGTIAGSDPGDSWSGTATFELVTPGDPRYDEWCWEMSYVVGYCYVLVGGDLTWVGPGKTIPVSLAPPDGVGVLQLIVSDESEEERNGTYVIKVYADSKVTMTMDGGYRRYASQEVPAWTQATDDPKYPADYHLAGTQSYTGCGMEACGTQGWSWDLTPVFDD